MKIKELLVLAYIGLVPGLLYGQSGIGTDQPQAMLDVRSQSGGILIPRMTAAQIEQIASPDEGEMVFSTSDTGVQVDRVGFWYYDGAAWVPIIAKTSAGDVIYNADGSLLSDRVVTMDTVNLNFGPGKLFLNGEDGFTGINTTQPAERLDVNGDMRVRSLTQGNVMTTNAGELSVGGGGIHRYGDIRFSYVSTDHDGWYLLNGRALTNLPADAQARAAALGIAGNLPNAAGRYVQQGAPGTLSGAASVTLARSNFPNFTLSGSTGYVSHTHNLVSPGFTVVRGTNVANVSSGNAWSYQLAGGATPGSTNRSRTYTTTSAGAHSHTVTVATGGGNTPVSLNPSFVQLNYFIYLGK